MSETARPPQRWAIPAALGGVLFPILIIVGHDVIGGVGGEAPGIGSSAAEATAHALGSDVPRFYIGAFIGSVLAGLALLAFVAHASSAIRRWDDGWLPGAAFGAGVAAVVLQLLTMAIVLTAVRWADQLDPAVVGAIYVELSQTWALTFAPLATLIAIVSVAALRGDLMARWIGWFGVVLAPLVLAGELAHFASASEVGLAFVPIALSWVVWIPVAGIGLALRAWRLDARGSGGLE